MKINMKVNSTILSIGFIMIFSGCSSKIESYKVFEEDCNIELGKSFIPKMNQDIRQIYSENRYIYIFEYPKGCVFGFLTNRDSKPEKVIDWIIISGKEYCKDSRNWIFSF